MECRYDERMRNCKNMDEMAEYLLACVPIIKEYTAEVEFKQTTKKVSSLDISSKKGVQRNDIYKKYLHEVEGEVECKKQGMVAIDEIKCSSCGKFYTKIMDEASSHEICTECGMTEYILSDEVGFKEEQEIEKNIVYSYKRENHFNEWMSQFQAKESTSVPEEVINSLRSEFKKMKVKDLSEITHEKVKKLLKKLNYSKYYEHVPYISTILSGVTPPTMPQELEDRMRLMFRAMQAPFERNKPPNRKNFLSYSFVLYKMAELLGCDIYLPCFPLLKSKEKLYIQDRIWEGICRDLQWEFIRTV